MRTRLGIVVGASIILAKCSSRVPALEGQQGTATQAGRGETGGNSGLTGRFRIGPGASRPKQACAGSRTAAKLIKKAWCSPRCAGAAPRSANRKGDHDLWPPGSEERRVGKECKFPLSP